MRRKNKREQSELGPDSAGQSGDLQQISETPDADSESVAELLEEGSVYEANVVEGVEEGTNRSESRVTPGEVPEDDVPPEYHDEDDEKVA